MLKLEKDKKSYPAILGLLGLLSYLAPALLIGGVSTLLEADTFFLSLLTIGILGPLIFYLLIGVRETLPLKLILGFVAIMIAFMLGFGLGYAVAEIVPGGESSPIPNLVAFLVMNLLYAFLMAFILGGKKALGPFLAAGVLVGLVLGVVFLLLPVLDIGGLDLNLLFVFSSFGLTLGLGLGVS